MNNKFKVLQLVHFFINETVEIGVITGVKTNSIISSQPTYSISFLNDDFKIVNTEVDEEDVFSSYEDIMEFALVYYTREQFRQIFKHFTKTQFLKQEFQEGLPLDEFIYQPVKS